MYDFDILFICKVYCYVQKQRIDKNKYILL